MGDEAAVNLLKILGTRTDFTETERATALEIIKRAFEEPPSIMIANDRMPHATLFLLKYLNGLTEDAGAKAQIAETRESVTKSLQDAGIAIPQPSN
jgi:chaperonin GroEL (HSP60 family)